MKNHYEVLGVSLYAEPGTIRSSYKRLVQKYHPDRCKQEDAHHKLTRINVAYKVLSNPEKREKYDLLLMLFDRYQVNFDDLENIFEREKYNVYIPGSKKQRRFRKLKKAIYWFLNGYTNACYGILVVIYYLFLPVYYLIVFSLRFVKLIYRVLIKCIHFFIRKKIPAIGFKS